MVYSRSEVRLENIERSFSVPLNDIKRIMKNFHLEMVRGLKGEASSLKMIPTYVDIPAGSEKGKFIALDLGGTNFRILELELKGGGKTAAPKAMRFTLDKRYTTGTASAFFNFLAECVKVFLEKYKIGRDEKIKLGFTFSFPVSQSAIDSGRLLIWTKGFNVKGVTGKDVVKLFTEALARKQLSNVIISALTNDTVGTLVAGSYEDRACDVGVIIGTGTNACYREDIGNIIKWKGPRTPTGRMIINTEWGNFNKLKLTPYDKRLDRESDRPGEQILEKMVSGMYLGKLTQLILKDLMGKSAPKILKTEEMSSIEKSDSIGLSEDKKLIRRVCGIVSKRAARISAAAVASIIVKIDPLLSKKHTIAIDGSVYERHPKFAKDMKRALKEIFGKRESRIRAVLAKDGSGRGGAIIAAIARR